MPSRIDRRLNRTVQATIPTTEFASDFFAAVQLYSVPGNPIYIDSISYGWEGNAADTAVHLRQSVGVYRDIPLIENLALAGQVANKEELLHLINDDIGASEPFDQPLILEAGYLYTVVVNTPLLSAPVTGTVTLFLTVMGRYVPDNPIEKLPVDLRQGIADELPAATENGSCSKES